METASNEMSVNRTPDALVSRRFVVFLMGAAASILVAAVFVVAPFGPRLQNPDRVSSSGNFSMAKHRSQVSGSGVIGELPLASGHLNGRQWFLSVTFGGQKRCLILEFQLGAGGGTWCKSRVPEKNELVAYAVKAKGSDGRVVFGEVSSRVVEVVMTSQSGSQEMARVLAPPRPVNQAVNFFVAKVSASGRTRIDALDRWGKSLATHRQSWSAE